MEPSPVKLWRCASCEKWSHAKYKPKQHQRFIKDIDYEQAINDGLSLVPSAFEAYNGVMVWCGPFIEYLAAPVYLPAGSKDLCADKSLVYAGRR
jgi:hypothetical protein